jgi:hypothetical protein
MWRKLRKSSHDRMIFTSPRSHMTVTAIATLNDCIVILGLFVLFLICGLQLVVLRTGYLQNYDS